MLALTSFVVLSILQLVRASPLLKREYDVGICTGNVCDNCPYTFGTGSGFPECIIYTVDDLAGAGYEIQDNGQANVFFDVPPLDPGCSVVVRTPVSGNGCGGNQLIAGSATCAPVPVDSTFTLLFCCGTGDCGGAGVPTAFASSAQSLVLKDRQGNVIMPGANSKKRAAPEIASADEAKRSLRKRCDSFTPTSEPYRSDGGNNIISDTVTCGPTQGCSASVGGSVTESFGVEAGFEISDPLGIVSASVSVSWEQSIERNWDTTFEFGPGETGYVVFVPILTCVDGTFDGCGDGEVVTACGPTRDAGQMSGNVRGVVIRN